MRRPKAAGFFTVSDYPAFIITEPAAVEFFNYFTTSTNNNIIMRTTNNQCNHAEAIAREMHMYYAAQAHNESNTPIPHWADLTENDHHDGLP